MYCVIAIGVVYQEMFSRTGTYLVCYIPTTCRHEDLDMLTLLSRIGDYNGWLFQFTYPGITRLVVVFGPEDHMITPLPMEFIYLPIHFQSFRVVLDFHFVPQQRDRPSDNQSLFDILEAVSRLDPPCSLLLPYLRQKVEEVPSINK